MVDLTPDEFKTKVNNIDTRDYVNRYKSIAYLNKDKLQTTTQDVHIEDTNIILEQQQILLTVAGITAATFIITALFLGNM